MRQTLNCQVLDSAPLTQAPQCNYILKILCMRRQGPLRTTSSK